MTAPPFPLTPAPAWYAQVTPSTRAGIYYGPTPSPSFTLSQSGATAYAVRDFDGVTVSSGSVSGTTVAPATPAGGWRYGWYRLYLTGPSSDSLFGTSYGSYNFIVMRDDSRFIPNPAPGTSGGYVGSFINLEEVVRGVCAIGPERWPINNAADPTSGGVDGGNLPTLQASSGIAVSKTYYSASAYQDAARPRPLLVSFPAGGFDRRGLLNGSNNIAWAVYCKDGTVDGTQVFVEVVNGTAGSTKKLNVYYPNSSTLVESYDNLPGSSTVVDFVTAGSAYIRAYNHGASGLPVNSAPAAIGRTYYNGIAACVAALYPDVEWFEGPINEPDQNTMGGAETAQAMKVFTAAVKAGSASAKALGPSFTTAQYSATRPGGLWDTFLAAGGASSCDGLSYHGYGMQLGDLNNARAHYGAFLALLASYSVSKPLWQTEQGVFTPVYGVYHPRRARWTIQQIVAQEMFGVPKERNHLWYACSHGFWGQPTWFVNGDLSLNPQAALLRAFSEEVFGKTFQAQVDLGNYGNAMYLAGTWRNASDDTRLLIVQGTSKVTGATLTFTVTGATGSLVTVDAFGNEGTVTISNGRFTITPTDVPTYIRLPAGATVTCYRVHDWPLGGSGVNIGTTYQQYGSTGAGKLTDGVWQLNDTDGRGDLYLSAAALPDSATIAFASRQRIDRLLIWCGLPWQTRSTMTDFDVQTSLDGTTWTTQATVTNTPPATIAHASDAHGPGCSLETFWDERYVFDVKLPGPVTVQYVRLYCRATSYGGEPDATALAVGGQGTTPSIAIQEVALFCEDLLTPRYLLLH